MAAAVALLVSTGGDGASPGLYGGVGYVGIDELNAEISRRTEDLERASAQVKEIEDRIAALEPDIEAAQAERAVEIARARKVIILHDRMMRGGWLRAVLSSESLGEIKIFGDIWAKMLADEAGALEAIRSREDDLASKRESLEKDRDVLEKLEKDLEAHRKELESTRRTLETLSAASAPPPLPALPGI